jgi:predicted nuclease of predicted toxin-antitoxin system
MKFSILRFITDENIDVEVKDFLREKGFDVFDIKEARLFSVLDEAILERSYQEKRIVLTQDSDFGTLIFRDKKPFCGLVYIRPGHVSPNTHIETLEAVLNADFDVNFPFIIVAENTELSVKIRLRQF